MPLILPGNVGSATAATGFNVSNSLRFNAASNDHLNRTQTAGNRRKFTFSTWLKRCKGDSRMALFLANRSSSNYDQFYLNEAGYIEADFYHSGTQIFRYKTNALYRDPSAWYHMMFAVDTEHDTASSRVRIYVNGSEVTSFSTETNPSEDVDTHVNENSIVAYIGSDYNSNEPDYYLAETVMLDGTQATPSDFGEFDSDSGIWKPIDVSGLTFGTNGFYLQYKETGTSANASGIGADTSGQTNHFTVNNLTAVDQSIDTCTNNFATFNPLYRNSNSAINYTEGNLSAIPAADGSISFSGSTIAMPKTSTSKWYAEFKTPVAEYGSLGIMDVDSISQAINDNTDISSNSNGTSLGRVLFQQGNGVVYYIGGTASTGLSSEANNDIISIAWDAGAGKFYVAQNGTYGTISGTQQDPANGTAGVDVSGEAWYTASSAFVWYVGDNTTGASSQFLGNFGSPSFAISSGNTDGNGYGNFEYAVPSGFYALCTKNLAEFGG